MIGKTLIGALIALSIVAFLTSSAASATNQSVPPSNSPIVKIGETGLLDPEVSLRREDGFVFFYNQSRSMPVEILIDFGAHQMHCSGPNMNLSEPGLARSGVPIQPGSFSVVCFPERGSYTFFVNTPLHPGAPQKGTIVVE